MDSRYIKTKKSPLPKLKRVRKVYGSFEDTEKYFRCWNCGTINDIARAVGFDGNGIQVTDVIIPSSPSTLLRMNDLSTEQKITIGISNLELVMIKNGLDGDPIETYYTPRVTESMRGCFFCGVTNIY